METQDFKYRRGDLGELPATLKHLRIHIHFGNDWVSASNCMEMVAKKLLDRVALDANQLEIVSVEWCENPPDQHAEVGAVEPLGQGTLLKYDYEKHLNRLIIQLPRAVDVGERFWIRSNTRCFPSDHVLEGIYKDATPPGAPQQFMSQCQQWGFQRIMPIFDDCRAKCTMTTTIQADTHYTHLISNGNICRHLHPDGKPLSNPMNPGFHLVTFDNPIPMAPYLFLVCAGTWDALVDQVVYPSGRSVRLEYLVPPGAVEAVRLPMEILKRSILWIGETQGYEYGGDTYRTICMNKSNFGGMENVGNTTIVTDAALIGEHTLDQSLLYAHAVIVHEFEHNQCGSETTMESPFDVWLNEAFTVDVERQFMADQFDPGFVRLNQVESIRNPLLGPLAIEDGGHLGRIVREGFNDPDELIDGVTYVKAAEVIRMLRLVLGADVFKAGKNLYFSRYRYGNANSDEFFSCFEEVAGRSLHQFKVNWLNTIGYPRVTAVTSYHPEKLRYRIQFEQQVPSGLQPFHLPIELALVNQAGRDLEGTRRTFELNDKRAELVMDNVPEAPAFASMNRDYSFYGTFRHDNATRDSLLLQTRLDPNLYNRVDAMRQLTDQQRIRMLTGQSAEVEADWLEIYGDILSDQDLPATLKAYLLRIDEQPLERLYCTWYQELVVIREKLMLAVNGAFRPLLRKLFLELDTYGCSPDESLRQGIENRMLKQVLLDLLVIDDSEDSHDLIMAHLESATTAQDQVSALLALNRSSSPRRRAVLEQTYHAWKDHLSGYANYLRVVASGTRPDVFAMIKEERQRSSFDVTQPTWTRALFLPMAVNNKMVWTDEGVHWVSATVKELATINATTASRLLNTFQHVGRLRLPLQKKVIEALRTVVDGVSFEACPTIHGQAKAYLKNVEVAEQTNGL
jgi:aminopeptidase N